MCEDNEQREHAPDPRLTRTRPLCILRIGKQNILYNTVSPTASLIARLIL